MTKLYRRVPPDQKPDCTVAFIPGKKDLIDQQTGLYGLSTFSADIASPRSVLQSLIDEANKKIASTDPKIVKWGQNQLAKFGSTVEVMLQRGWSIREISSDVFTSHGFTCGEPEEDGHVSVNGLLPDFELKAMDLEEASSEVPASAYDNP